VIDLMEAEEAVIAHLNRIACIDQDVDEHGEEIPLSFPLTFFTLENAVVCRATLYTRFNGAVVLRIDADVTEADDSASATSATPATARPRSRPPTPSRWTS
jgi:hypothetical protein